MLTIKEVIKTINNAFNQKLKKHHGNWDQNDPSADDYIKNRPFYTGSDTTVSQLPDKYIPSTIARASDVVPTPSAAQVGQTLVVKAVDESGKPAEWETKSMKDILSVFFVDGTAVVPGMLTYYGQETMSEIIDILGNLAQYHVVFCRAIMNSAGQFEKNVTATGYHTYTTDSGVKNARVFFGSDVCPVILDSANNKIILDPDWVAPADTLTETEVISLIRTELGVIENGTY